MWLSFFYLVLLDKLSGATGCGTRTLRKSAHLAPSRALVLDLGIFSHNICALAIADMPDRIRLELLHMFVFSQTLLDWNKHFLDVTQLIQGVGI